MNIRAIIGALRQQVLIVSILANIASAQNARVVEAGQGSLSITYATSFFRPDTVIVGSEPSLYFRESELRHLPQGAPALPSETFLVGIPPTGSVTLEILNEQFRPAVTASMAPIPTIRISDDSLRSVVRLFASSPASGSSGATSASLKEIRWIRYQKVAVIEVLPYSYDAATKRLAKRDNLTLRLRFSAGTERSMAPSPPDPHFESTYASLVVNYEQAKQWRSMPPSQISSSASYDSTGGWFDPSKEYVRIAVAEDGLFRVTYEQMQTAGALPSGILVSTQADLFNKGTSIPFVMSDGGDGIFGPGDFMDFYGTAHYDSGLVKNEYSDTSIYWLTFDGTGNARPTVDSAVSASDTIAYTRMTVRLEKDVFYFFGNGGLPVNNQSGKAFGEGWYWRRLLANQSASFPFTARNLYTAGNPIYTIRGRLHSPVSNTASPNHDAEVRLNGTLVANVQFAGSKDTVFSLPVSSSVFLEGQNSIAITSKPTAASINEFSIDWLEVTSQRTLSADGDTLVFTAESAAPGTVAQFRLTGFTADDIGIYRIDANGGIEKILAGAVTGSGPYEISFTDTALSGRKYYALTGARKRSAPILTKKTFTNLRSGSLGADYLMVTAREVVSEAQRLAAYRSQQGLGRSSVVLVDDIYDEFSFGHFDPGAIRRFLLAVDTLWTAPRPSYVLFFGDASWDYKNNLSGGRRNLVPSLGNPVSDSWLVAPADDVFHPGKKTGRVPVRSLAEASSFVNMVIEYESKTLTPWNKRFLFMASGFDAAETQRFVNFSETLISQRIVPPPVSGEVTRLYKTSPVVDFEQTEEAKRVLEQGAVWMNFYGHAGTDFWGNGLSDPSQFVNDENKRHLISDISCSTVRFAEPLVESFSEKLLFAGAGGVVAYLGSSGFGYEGPLQTIARELYRQMAQDTVRELGTLLFNAKVALRGAGTPSIFSQFALQQMTLLGDPATKLRVAVKPDLTVDVQSVSTVPSQPTEADNEVSLRIPVRNLGLNTADSVAMRLHHNNQNEQTVIDVVSGPVGLVDTVSVTNAAFRRSGLHSISLTIDPDGLISEESESNNSAQLTFFVGSGQVLPLYPLASSAVHPSSVRLTIQNPGTPATAAYAALFELDTTEAFSSPARISQTAPQGIVTTSWNIPPGALADNTQYFWRARMVSGPDSTDWSGSFFLASSASVKTWIQDRPSLFSFSSGTELRVDSLVRLQSKIIPLAVTSAGFSDGNDAAVWVDGVNISQGFSGRGYNVAVVNQYSGEVEFFGAFSIYSDSPDTSLTEPLIQFIQNIPSGRRVIVGVADEGSRNKTERLNLAMESLGSAMIRSLTFRGSWALIGQKGAGIGSVPEGRTTEGGGQVGLEDTVAFNSIRGGLTSPVIGTALAWTDAAVDVDTSAAGTHVSLDIVRFYTGGTMDTVYQVPMAASSILNVLGDSVSSVRLRANLAADSGGISPALLRWWMDFDSPPELTSNYQAARILADSVMEGEPLALEADIYNVGPSPAENVRVSISAIENNIAVPFYETILPMIAPAAFGTIQGSYSTAGRTGRVDLLVQIDPDEEHVELQTVNNSFSYSAFVRGDTIPPSFDVTFDGIRIFDNDYVKQEPDIRITVRDNSPLPITDPNSVLLLLNGRRVSLGSAPDSLFETLTGAEKVRVTFRPTLQKGDHLLSVQVLDASGNPADSMEYEIRFNVETDLRLVRVFNMPNPFSSETAFTFHLTGVGIPDDVRLRIYTTAGRLIYERRLYPGEVNIGFNRIVWDGRDQNGDPVANGVYFYKVSAVQDGKRVEVIEKLARVR